MKNYCILLKVHYKSSAQSYVKTVTPDALKSFLDKSCRPVFTSSSAVTGRKEETVLKIAVLKGMYSAMLYDMMEFVYKHTNKESDVSAKC